MITISREENLDSDNVYEQIAQNTETKTLSEWNLRQINTL